MLLDQESLDLAVSAAGLGRWEYDPASKATVLDDQCRKLLGCSKEQARSIDRILPLIHRDDRAEMAKRLGAIIEDGQEFEHVFRVRRPEAGHRWLRGIGRMVERNGQARILGVTLDVTAEQELLAERDLHLEEMSHRIKNLFALVSAMISNANRESGSQPELVEKLRGRVEALDRAHSLMIKTDSTKPVSLHDLLENILEPARGVQPITFDGDDVQIPVNKLTPLVLIFHEWITNSIKYGALQQCDGEIAVRWAYEPDGLRLVWREKVEAYNDQLKRGFGSRLIHASAQQLKAVKTRDYVDGWLIIDMLLPLHVPDPR
ncbi:sensor histidine kinase [Chachezhania antarctica]|uniref:sensor histidine kinase n=1 Tax=Chachezhania antarctica TaxID=2340860 RepID=UPI000EACE2DC|nr:HWE histidine kinase domain-containing protein [Chachezhania antarctica]|tara:strand:- start:2648 stop:3601 length:954 start_codon:yes stop_codon:yes gene_type:complete